jgi:hypothetical protein
MMALSPESLISWLTGGRDDVTDKTIAALRRYNGRSFYEFATKPREEFLRVALMKEFNCDRLHAYDVAETIVKLISPAAATSAPAARQAGSLTLEQRDAVIGLLNAKLCDLPKELPTPKLVLFPEERVSPRTFEALRKFVDDMGLNITVHGPLHAMLQPAADVLRQVPELEELCDPQSKLPAAALLELLVKHGPLHVVVLVPTALEVLPVVLRSTQERAAALCLAYDGQHFSLLVPLPGSMGFEKLLRLLKDVPTEANQAYAPFKAIQQAYEKAGKSPSASLQCLCLLSVGAILDYEPIKMPGIGVDFPNSKEAWERWDAIETRMKLQFDKQLDLVQEPSPEALRRVLNAEQLVLPAAQQLVQPAPSPATTAAALEERLWSLAVSEADTSEADTARYLRAWASLFLEEQELLQRILSTEPATELQQTASVWGRLVDRVLQIYQKESFML